jgi:hypothetical protein
MSGQNAGVRGGPPLGDSAAAAVAASAASAAAMAEASARAQRVAAREAARRAADAAIAEAARLDAIAHAAGDAVADGSAAVRGMDGGVDASLAADAAEDALLEQLAQVRAVRALRMSAAQGLPPGGAGSGAAASPAAHSTPRAGGPQPKSPYQERYKGEGGIALDKWISSATIAREFFTGMDDVSAVTWLAPALEDAALDWFIAYRTQHGSPPVSPQALFAGLRARFQPVNAKETARRDLDTLRQNKDSVNDYTTKFRRLIALLPGETEDSQIYQYRRGLMRAIEDRIMQAEPQPSSLEATIALATRVEGRWRANHSGIEGAAPINFDTDVSAQLSALVDAAVQRGFQSTSQSTQRHESRQDRGANKRASGKTMAQHFGLSEEVTRKRFDGGLCMHCGVTGHIRRECPEFKAGKPPRLN